MMRDARDMGRGLVMWIIGESRPPHAVLAPLAEGIRWTAAPSTP